MPRQITTTLLSAVHFKIQGDIPTPVEVEIFAVESGQALAGSYDPNNPATWSAAWGYTANITVLDQNGNTISQPDLPFGQLAQNYSNCPLGSFCSLPVSANDFNHTSGELILSDTDRDINIGLSVGASGADESSIELVLVDGLSLTPIPATLPLFVTGLSVLGLFGWRRKRKNAVAIQNR